LLLLIKIKILMISHNL